MARRPSVSKRIPSVPAAPEVVIYLRVSTEEQANSGLGLESQEARCRAWALANGFEIVAVFVDAGASAKTLRRPELEKALAALRPGRLLLAYKIDRLTRSLMDFPLLAERVEDAGAELATVEERFDTSTAMGRAMLSIVLVFSQLERELIAERTTAALRAKRDRGERLGAEPLGYRRGDAGELIEDPEELATLLRIGELRSEGRTLEAIAETLTAEGRPTKRGGTWAKETVRKLLLRTQGEENENGRRGRKRRRSARRVSEEQA